MEVKIYSTPTCPYCRMTKEYLKQKGVKFTDIDVAGNKEKAKEMIAKSGQMGVPVVFVGDRMIIGFDKVALGKALK